jgi:acetyl-CoA synthetase
MLIQKIEFVDSLPKTTSGKIQRGLLKQQEIAKMQQAYVSYLNKGNI